MITQLSGKREAEERSRPSTSTRRAHCVHRRAAGRQPGRSCLPHEEGQGVPAVWQTRRPPGRVQGVRRRPHRRHRARGRELLPADREGRTAQRGARCRSRGDRIVCLSDHIILQGRTGPALTAWRRRRRRRRVRRRCGRVDACGGGGGGGENGPALRFREGIPGGPGEFRVGAGGDSCRIPRGPSDIGGGWGGGVDFPVSTRAHTDKKL